MTDMTTRPPARSPGTIARSRLTWTSSRRTARVTASATVTNAGWPAGIPPTVSGRAVAAGERTEPAHQHRPRCALRRGRLRRRPGRVPGASDNTRRAYRQQWAAFTTWASAQGYPSLPALDATLAAYLTRLAGQGQALASIRQARGAVVKAHQLAGFPTPAGPVAAAALLGIGRSIGAAQGQAAPLTAEGLAAIRATAHLPRRGRGGCPERAAFARRRGLVDVALASVIRDGLLRVSETVALAWADVAPAPDGSGIATVRRSKTDPESQGQAVYLGQAAMTALAAIRPADVDGAAPIFGLSVRQLPRRIQAMARAAGLGEGFSGHSGRVGMAQDLAASGAELPALMVAGRWQSARMPARYTEKQALGRGAVARYYQERGGS